jgi:2-polyprenyl-3-methyl-5-hydroxy-6-metoxy-1,4-benzoquinol methylase
MTSASEAAPRVLEQHARLSLGSSHTAIYRLVARALADRRIAGGCLVDVGCGGGALRPFAQGHFDRYVGMDGVRYADFPDDAEFYQVDFDCGAPLPAGDAIADVVAAVETIEHLENPRALARELVRLVKPGGWVILTTPNQRSLLSLLTLTTKGRFSAFQDSHYPAHITALLDIDLCRIGSELGLTETAIEYTRHGRIPLTPWHYPTALARLFPRALSDNLLYIGRKPMDGTPS